MKHIFFLIFSTFVGFSVIGQQVDVPIGHYSHALFERWDIQTAGRQLTAIQPYARQKYNVFANDTLAFNLNTSEAFQWRYLALESGDSVYRKQFGAASRPLFKVFYREKPDFYHHRQKSFELHVNPVWELNIGKDSRSSKLLYRNGRGIDLYGTIDDKISFYTRATTNQIEYPVYIKSIADSTGVVPYEGFWKEYGEKSTDFFRAFGYVDFGFSKHISAQIGFGRHFIGEGVRSMILSDYSNSYPYLRLDTEIWKFRYTNLFAELVADVYTYAGGTLGNSDYPKKYMAFHHLEFNPFKELTIGLFESIIIGRPDSVGGASFEYKYLNPIIFYRALEQHDGSDYNALVGLDFSWDLWKSVRWYGQFTLDELVISNVIQRTGWWSNKYAWQMGIKYIDFLINQLDLRLEVNSARPYTYSHDDLYTSYTHYLQPLAHPLGANFTESIIELIYRPFPRWDFTGTALAAQYGLDDRPGQSVGKNILLSQNLFFQEFGNKIGQGESVLLSILQFRASYQWKHNFFLDGNVMLRNESREVGANQSQMITLGFRWNMPYRNYLF